MFIQPNTNAGRAQLIAAERRFLNTPMHVRNQHMTMLLSQEHDGRDWVRVYFRGHNNRLITTTTIPHDDSPKAALERAWAWFKRVYPAHGDHVTLCHD